MMNILLWTFQVVLAAGFAASAAMKGTWDRDRLVQSGQTGVRDLPIPLIRFIALSEALGALGLVFPLALGVAPWLTVLAAIALTTVMLLATGVHITLREPRNVAKTVAIVGACLFVAFGRGLRVSLY